MRLDDNLSYSPKHVYRVPGRVRYTTKLALDARYGEGRWVAPYAPIIERSPAIEFEEVAPTSSAKAYARVTLV